MVDQSGRDLLSELPSDIIHNILTFVPIRDAVKTSILSRQWRYKWATLPHLVFEYKYVSSSKEDATKLKHFITQALALHKGPIHTFKLDAPFIESCQYTDQWLLLLSRKDIKTLILNVEDTSFDWRQLHSSLYSCRNLNHLELIQCEIPPPPPAFKGFLRLRRVVLDYVVYVNAPSGVLESLVASSPLLEEFTLRNYDDDNYQLRIHAPNLKYFYFRGYHKDLKYLCLYAPLLAKTSATLHNKDLTIQQKSYLCNYTNFLGACTNLEELSGDDYFIKFCCRCSVGSCHFSLVFNRLRVIKLHRVNFEDIKAILVVVRLIMGAPNLQRLKISSCSFASNLFNKFDQIASKVNPSMILWKELAPDFRFDKLKLIEMEKINGLRNEMKLVKFLLERSPVLESLIFKVHDHVDDQKLLTLMAKLLRYRRASTNAQIFLFKQKLKL